MANTQKKFSLIVTDHGHEKNNGIMKDDGGIIGLTQDAASLLRLLEEVQKKGHHEQPKATQQCFSHQVASLVHVVESMGNPFEEESQDLLRLNSKDTMDQSSVACLRTIQSQGQEQYREFVKEMLIGRVKPITSTINKNKIILFNAQPHRVKSKSKEDVKLLLSESSILVTLYITCQNRDDDFDNFFSQDNHPFPPSLSAYGQLRLGTKSDLIH